ncbi:membrane protein [Streptomyces sp. SBT349]|uniref:membrane protein n=1 Tax=Streptomyces sp. SBT349 TaxID=1580539 RepID=UPI00066AD48C|nr:membrane protein [Streptomyces sp. SBT349]
MRDKAVHAALCAVLLVYLGLVGHRGVLLVREGTWVTVPLGAAVLVLPLLGAWFLWRGTRFVLGANRLARRLDAEGGLPVDDLPRTPSGRVDRTAADAAFAARKAETEEHPEDWRCWFRLAVAYRDARDTPRARKAMQHALDLHALDPHASHAPAGAAAERKRLGRPDVP